jgi:hypothetical protein
MSYGFGISIGQKPLGPNPGINEHIKLTREVNHVGTRSTPGLNFAPWRTK